jgi:hypothetical protein
MLTSTNHTLVWRITEHQHHWSTFYSHLFFSHLNVVKCIKVQFWTRNAAHQWHTQALPLEECSGLIRNRVYATDKKTEQCEEERYAKTFTCYSQMHRIESEQNCDNENRCNSRYVLRKQDSTYDEVAWVTTIKQVSVALSASFELLRTGLHIRTTGMEWLREILTSRKNGEGGNCVGKGLEEVCHGRVNVPWEMKTAPRRADFLWMGAVKATWTASLNNV